MSALAAATEARVAAVEAEARERSEREAAACATADTALFADAEAGLEALRAHGAMRSALFAPVRSPSGPQRSVLYQKARDLTIPAAAPTVDVDDADPCSGRGRLEVWSGLELTGHEATELAAEREDAARGVCNAALKAVRDARSILQTRRSAVQLAVQQSRETCNRQRRVARSGGSFGCESRDTNPASRMKVTNPLD